MSTKGIESVLTKAMSEPAFADSLFNDIEKALTGFDLTPEEIASLKAMSRAEFDKLVAASPEERKSFVMLGGWDGNHNQTELFC